MRDVRPPLQTRLSEADERALREQAEREGTTVAALLRRAVREMLRRQRRED